MLGEKRMSLNSRRKYFNRKKPTGSIALLILGALIFIFALSSDCNFILAIFGLALSAGAVYMITAFSLAHSDDTIDNFCNSLAAEYCAAKKANRLLLRQNRYRNCLHKQLLL